MSADASITLDWAGEERKFRLGIGQLRELQEAINRPRAAIGAPMIGPKTLLSLLIDGDAWPDEVRSVIRLGLIGAGHPIAQVPALVRSYVDERPILESTKVAQAILLAALVGVPDDPVGKKPRRRRRSAPKTATSSSSPQSTEPAAPLDFPPIKSTACPSGNFPPASTDTTAPMVPKMNPTP